MNESEWKSNCEMATVRAWEESFAWHAWARQLLRRSQPPPATASLSRGRAPIQQTAVPIKWSQRYNGIKASQRVCLEVDRSKPCTQTDRAALFSSCRLMKFSTAGDDEDGGVANCCAVRVRGNWVPSTTAEDTTRNSHCFWCFGFVFLSFRQTERDRGSSEP